MSYRSWKRRDQKRRRIAKIEWWKEYRQVQSDRAFEEWKSIHVDQLRKEYLESSV